MLKWYILSRFIDITLFTPLDTVVNLQSDIDLIDLEERQKEKGTAYKKVTITQTFSLYFIHVISR